MQPILVAYATREGQTRKIAEHVGADLRSRGLSADVVDVRDLPKDFSLGTFAAVIVAASVHLGRHEPEMIEFVKRNLDALSARPAAFLSVSMAESDVERPTASDERRAQAERDRDAALAHFFEATGWHPDKVKPIAGALLYTKYNVLVRFFLKQIVKRAGGDTDTSRDHEYTDWEGLDRFVGEIVARVS